MAVRKPLRPCNHIGCTNLTNQSYCKDHLYIIEEKEKERQQHYDKYKRNQKSKRFYGSGLWRRTREHRMLLDKGLCQHCLKENKITYATLVDHIIPILIDWSLRLSIKNLQSLCDSCHAIKTIEDKKSTVIRYKVEV